MPPRIPSTFSNGVFAEYRFRLSCRYTSSIADFAGEAAQKINFLPEAKQVRGVLCPVSQTKKPPGLLRAAFCLVAGMAWENMSPKGSAD